MVRIVRFAHLHAKRISLRAALSAPHIWALLGTPFPPCNVVMSAVFWIARGRSSGAQTAARCLNVQITYTLAFFLPIMLAAMFTEMERPGGVEFTLPGFLKLLTGFPLGVAALAGVLCLAFFNVRSFALTFFGYPYVAAPRIRFIRE